MCRQRRARRRDMCDSQARARQPAKSRHCPRSESADTGIEVLAIAAGLLVMLWLAAAVVSQGRSAAAVHDTARQAGYAALANISGEIASSADDATVETDVQTNLEDVWREQLQWMAARTHSAALEDCGDSANVTNVEVRSIALSDADGTSNRAAMLEFEYSCEIEMEGFSSLGLDDFTMTIGGSWAEIAPWL